MSSLTNYNGLTVLTPNPSGTGGLTINNNFKALSTHIDTVDPTTSNDSTQNYTAGSRWYNESTTREWVCLSAAVGAAVWQVMAPTPTYDQTILSDSPIIYYTLGDTTGTSAPADSSGFGLTGSFIGTAGTDYSLGNASIVPGDPGTCIETLTASGGVATPALTLPEFTIEFWAIWPDVTAAQQACFGYSSAMDGGNGYIE